MNQQMTHHQQMNAQQHQQQMGMQHHAPMGAGNRPHPNGGQQQGKKKGKP
jgi:hypothetical protein